MNKLATPLIIAFLSSSAMAEERLPGYSLQSAKDNLCRQLGNSSKCNPAQFENSLRFNICASMDRSVGSLEGSKLEAIGAMMHALNCAEFTNPPSA